MSSSVWLTSKGLETRFRRACSVMVESMLSENDKGAGQVLHDHLLEFEALKKEQVEVGN